MVGESGNTTKKLMKRNIYRAMTCLTGLPSKNYEHVVVLDIGSIGRVVIPGFLEKASAEHAVICTENIRLLYSYLHSID